MNQTALVTGASSGLGAEFARQLAATGYDLVLVARSATPMHKLASTLRDAHGVRVDVLVQDLAEPDAANQVMDALRSRELRVDLLINNAGFGTCGRFEDISSVRDHEQLMVNVVALVDLTHALVPAMLKRGSGGVVNIASTAAFQPAAYFAVYSSAKAFVLNFTLALWSEYRSRGVTALAVCPGPVDTGFFDVIGTRRAAIGGRMATPQQVVAQTLRALARDGGYVVPGAGNFFAAHFQPRRPRKLLALISRRVTSGVLAPS